MSAFVNPYSPSNWYTATVTVTAADLATVNLNIIMAPPGAQYVVRNIIMNAGGTNFSGGDRDAIINCFGNIYSTIPAAALSSLTNAQWGETSVPYPAPGFPMNTPTPAGFNLSIQKSGGTVDWASGSFVLDVIYQRVV